jgi:UDP-GlcNAc:undecaprenyl-phosphate GlcNAc-1-phosphate transferase
VLVGIMIRVGALDHPVARSSHAVPTPKGGGVGIAAAYGVGTLWLLYKYTVPFDVLAPVGAGLVLAVVSYIDDVRQANFAIKLAAQVAAALCVIVAGDRAGTIDIAGAAWHVPLVFCVPLTLAWLVFVTNAVNFIDGLNGLASGSVGLAGAALSAAAPGALAAQAVPLVAGIVGFLPFNFPRARIFMGDVGSQLCGFVAADLAVRAAPFAAVSLIVPLSLLPILLDVAFTLLRRARAGARLTEAHRGHLYQVANRAGMNAALVALLYWMFAVWGAACGWLAGISQAGVWAGGSAVLATLVPLAAWFMVVSVKAKRAGITHW